MQVAVDRPGVLILERKWFPSPSTSPSLVLGSPKQREEPSDYVMEGLQSWYHGLACSFPEAGHPQIGHSQPLLIICDYT